MADKRRTIWKSSARAERVDALLAGIRELILSARRAVVRSVDAVQVMTSFEIGRRMCTDQFGHLGARSLND